MSGADAFANATPAPGAQFVLHVGMPKCGSSALQTALSAAPELAGAGARRGRYIVLHSTGVLYAGRDVVERAGVAPSGYLVSARASDLEAASAGSMSRMRDELASLAAAGDRLLLSNEGWGQEYPQFEQGGYLERLGMKCDVVLYVRPQVSWCNSAWWQWGAWTRAPLLRWVKNHLERIQWDRVADGWRRVPGVASVRVRLLPANVVDDFCSFLALAPPAEVVANPGLPAAVLRVFQRHRSLRTGPHDSAIEFALGRQLRFEAARSPWVMKPALVGQVIESCRDSNLRLLEQLDEPQRAQMRDDAAWWSAEHYAQRAVEPWQIQPPVAQDVDALAAAALESLHQLDSRYRELEHELLMHKRKALAHQAVAPREERASVWPFRLRKDSADR